MSQEELKAIEKRIYELKDLSILAVNKGEYNKFCIYIKELRELEKRLKKAKKECDKNEK